MRFARHRSNCCLTFGGMQIIGDYENSCLYALDMDTYTDNTNTIRRVRTSQHINKDNASIIFNNVQVEFEGEQTLSPVQALEIKANPQSQAIYLMEGTAANAQINVTGVPVGTVTVGDETWTFSDTVGPYKILKSSNNNTQCENIAIAINRDSSVVSAHRTQVGINGQVYYVSGQVTVVARTIGAAGNSIPVSENATGLIWCYTNYLAGGYDTVTNTTELSFRVDEEFLLIGLEWSDDGGHTWSNKHMNTIGLANECGYRTIWRRLGVTRDRIFRLTFTMPIKAVILGAFAEIEDTAA